MVKTATTIVQEHQVVKDACGGCGRTSNAGLFVASFVYVVGFAKRFKISAITVKIEANVCDIFFEEWHHRIWVSNVSRNTKRILVTIRQASLLCLSAQRVCISVSNQNHGIETTATIIEEHQVI
jgi:hypothetical protein